MKQNAGPTRSSITQVLNEQRKMDQNKHCQVPAITKCNITEPSALDTPPKGRSSGLYTHVAKWKHKNNMTKAVKSTIKITVTNMVQRTQWALKEKWELPSEQINKNSRTITNENGLVNKWELAGIFQIQYNHWRRNGPQKSQYCPSQTAKKKIVLS